MIIFDYNAKNEPQGGITIENARVHCSVPKLTGVLFRNYPELRIAELQVEGCAFENCRTVRFEDCSVEDCSFARIDTLYADRTPIVGSGFAHLRCDDDCVISLEDSNITQCAFQDVVLTEESYLIDATGDVWIEACIFENICTDREDRELFFCEEITGKLFKRKKQLCVVDEDSCTGLDKVRYIG